LLNCLLVAEVNTNAETSNRVAFVRLFTHPCDSDGDSCFTAGSPDNDTLRRWEGGQLGWFADLSKQRSRPAATAGARAEDDDEEEDAAAAGGLTVLADALAGLLGRLGAKPHVFALGPASEAVGTHCAPRVASARIDF